MFILIVQDMQQHDEEFIICFFLRVSKGTDTRSNIYMSNSQYKDQTRVRNLIP
jgi:hypothetical protein